MPKMGVTPQAALPLHIGTLTSLFSAGFDACQATTTFNINTFNWPAQNRGLYVPVSIPFAYPVRRIWWVNGSVATGNQDFAIYNEEFVRFFRTEPKAQSGNSLPQYIDVTDFWLPAGRWYFFLSNDSATTTTRAFGNTEVKTQEGRMGGLVQQASVANAPEKGTPEAWASEGLPNFGITRTASGF